MPDSKAGGADRRPHIGLRDKTVAYLTAIKRYNLDPLMPQRPRLSATALLMRRVESELLAAAGSAPERAEVHTYLGVLFLERGEFEEAERHFKESVKRAVTSDALTLLGVSRVRLDKLRPARRTFREAIDTDPEYKEAYYNLALTLSYKKHDKAIQLLGRAVDLDSKYAAALRELGWALKLRGSVADAERHLRRAITLDKSDGWAYIYLGNLMWGRARPAEAERAYKAAIKVWPQEGTPYWCLADFYKERGRPGKAVSLYEKAVRLNPDSSTAHSRLGLFLLQIGERVKARKHLEKALSLDPNFERVKAALSELKKAR